MNVLIKENGVIDTPIELLIVILIGLIGIIVLFKIANFLESLPVVEKKIKEKVVTEKKKEVKVEVKKEVKEEKKEKESVTVKSKETSEKDVKDTKTETSSTSSVGHSCPYANCMPQQTIIYTNGYDPQQNYNAYGGYNNNYLYDRFVDHPSNIDSVKDNKISEAFMSDSEYETARSNVNIKVNNVENINSSSKAGLYSRIQQMTSSNLESREKLLKEFEGLSKEMKLLIIDNIIQKM